MRIPISIFVLLALTPAFSIGADWTRFRGPGGVGISGEKKFPVK